MHHKKFADSNQNGANVQLLFTCCQQRQTVSVLAPNIKARHHHARLLSILHTFALTVQIFQIQFRCWPRKYSLLIYGSKASTWPTNTLSVTLSVHKTFDPVIIWMPVIFTVIG